MFPSSICKSDAKLNFLKNYEMDKTVWEINDFL